MFRLGNFFYSVFLPQISRFWLVGSGWPWVIRCGLLIGLSKASKSDLFMCVWERDSPTQFGDPHFLSVHQENPMVRDEAVMLHRYSIHTCLLQLLNLARLFKCANITLRMLIQMAQAVELGLRSKGTRLPGAKAGPWNIWSSLPSLWSPQVSPLPDGRQALPEHMRPGTSLPPVVGLVVLLLGDSSFVVIVCLID